MTTRPGNLKSPPTILALISCQETLAAAMRHQRCEGTIGRMKVTPNNNKRQMRSKSKLVLSAIAPFFSLAIIFVLPANAQSQRIENNVAIFAALDKVTAKIKKLEVPVDEAAQFGSLTLRPRVCYSRPPTERPKTTTFVEIDEENLAGETKRLFTGWMFAESPGLHAVEHPVFDVWLTACKGPKSRPAAREERVDRVDGNGWQVEERIDRQPPRRRIRR